MKIVSYAKITAVLIVVLAVGCSVFRVKPDANPALRDDIVAIALRYKGTPYKWKGNTSDGFDCAGYVQFVFARAGFDVPRTSSQQFDSGKKIARSDLKRGDLVFFTRWKFFKIVFPPNHVGIYIGGNRFIHAPSPGKTVRIDNMDNVYWNGHYKGARNLLSGTI